MDRLDAARRRFLAIAALVFAVVACTQIVALAFVAFPRSAAAVLLVAGGLVGAWYGATRRGAVHVVGLVAGALLLLGFVALMITQRPELVIGSLVALAMCVVCATYVFRRHVALPAAARPAQPVMIWNPRSGGGKAARAHLDDEARARGIVPIELAPGNDLAQLVRDALDGGADAIAVAGGDGSQAIAACIAADRGVPYACIPAGTRNHFALDLGVDRDDVVGALDAFVDGGERRVDLGEVNGRTFVNNVSIGVYGEAVQRAGYRNAKLRTFLQTIPDVLGPGAAPELSWCDRDGHTHEGAAAIVVSNNAYRLGGALGDPSRPKLDEGTLGIAVLAKPGEEPGLRAWTSRTFEIDAPGPVHAGIDGEAVVLDPPLRFLIRPGALTCRIARGHPGASPAALAPGGLREAIRVLARIASGRPRRRGTSLASSTS